MGVTGDLGDLAAGKCFVLLAEEAESDLADGVAERPLWEVRAGTGDREEGVSKDEAEVELLMLMADELRVRILTTGHGTGARRPAQSRILIGVFLLASRHGLGGTILS